MKVHIVMGSYSDKAIGDQVVSVLKEFEVDYSYRVISAHRTPQQAQELAREVEQNNQQVIIAIAGKAAHLAGVLASLTTVPVIGVPVKASTLDGLDALLATVQMPKGVPVATVAIDGGANAALLALQMLALADDNLRQKLKDYKQQLSQETVAMDEKLQKELN